MTMPQNADIPSADIFWYDCAVLHRRLRPFGHRLAYNVAYIYANYDKLREGKNPQRLFSYNRFNLFSFYERDHGARDGSALRPWLEQHCAKVNLPRPEQIWIFTMPRLLGYVFNPISLFWLCDAQQQPYALFYQVKNTFGEQHCYAVPISGAPPFCHSALKNLHVSPFFDMQGSYRFRVTMPQQRFSLLIRYAASEGERLLATLTGRRKNFNTSTCLSIFARYPLLTVKVVAAIHWQAIKIWLKGAKFNKSPKPPDTEVSLGHE